MVKKIGLFLPLLISIIIPRICMAGSALELQRRCLDISNSGLSLYTGAAIVYFLIQTETELGCFDIFQESADVIF